MNNEIIRYDPIWTAVVFAKSCNNGQYISNVGFYKKIIYICFSDYAQISIDNNISPVHTIRFWNCDCRLLCFLFTLYIFRGRTFLRLYPSVTIFGFQHSHSTSCKLPRLIAVQQLTSDTCF